MKVYKIPFWSRVALRVYNSLPTRVQAWAWITAYDELDNHSKGHLRDVEEHYADGSKALFRAVPEIRIEKLRRKLYYGYLNAVAEEVEK